MDAEREVGADNGCVKQKTNWDGDGQQHLFPRQGRDDMWRVSAAAAEKKQTTRV